MLLWLMKANLSEKSHPAVTDLYATADGSLVAVAIQRQALETLLSFDLLLSMF